MTNSYRSSTAFSLSYKPILTTRARGSKLVCSTNDTVLYPRGSGFIAGGLPIHNGSTSSRMNVTKAITEQPSNAASSSTSTPKNIEKFTWGYVDDIGPDKWAQINEEWAICDAGKKQSPIALSYKASRIAAPNELRPTISIDGGGSSAKFSLFCKEAAAFSSTKWLVVEPRIAPPASFLGVSSPFNILSEKSPIVLSLPNVGTYRLKNVLFHTGGSEHVVNEKPAAMEAHFVFALDLPAGDPTSITDTTIPRGYGSSHCVVGVIIDEGPKTSPWLESIFTNSIKPLNKDIEEKGTLVELDMNQVLPNFNNSNIYTYDGSLTTPPGAEGIHWIVMNERASVTTQDWDMLETFQGGPNTRPLQKSNGREVVQFPVVVSEGHSVVHARPNTVSLRRSAFVGSDVVTQAEVETAQAKWAAGVVKIGSLKENFEECEKYTDQFLNERYAFDLGNVLFKPTKCAVQQFRPTKPDACSYFIAGGRKAYDEDSGFAVTPWTAIRFENLDFILEKDRAVAMGNYYFTDTSGGVTKVEYTFGYKKVDGDLKIDLHHSSLPFPSPK